MRDGTIALAWTTTPWVSCTGVYAKVYSLSLEIAGLMLVIGLAWALKGRHLLRMERLEGLFSDLVFPAWLLVIGLSGLWWKGQDWLP